MACGPLGLDKSQAVVVLDGGDGFTTGCLRGGKGGKKGRLKLDGFGCVGCLFMGGAFAGAEAGGAAGWFSVRLAPLVFGGWLFVAVGCGVPDREIMTDSTAVVTLIRCPFGPTVSCTVVCL